MGLLAPLFLAGLAALAVPILVHLVHRERKQPLAFPSLMFLRRVPFRSARRQRIRYWLLFLLRTAALILIALAFARPWLQRGSATAGAAAGGRDIVVLVDRSYSMSTPGQWERALRAAQDAVAAAHTRDRVAVIGFSEQAALLARLDDARSQAQAAVRNLKPSADVTRYAPAFKLAGSVLATAHGPAEIVVITDRQRSGWRNMDQVPVPPGTAVKVVDLSASTPRNLAVSDVRLSQSTFAGRQRIVPAARLVNRGDRDVSVPVQLRLNDRVQQERTVTVRARSVADVAFGAMFAANAVGDIRIALSDDVAADDVAYFTTETGGALVVRIVTGGDDASFYLERALAAGAAGELEVHRTGPRLAAGELGATNVAVFVETALPGGETGRQLEEYVRQGGGLVIVAGEHEGDHVLQPARSAERVRRDATLVSIDDSHPIFEPFRASGAEQFAAVRMSRYLRTTPAADASVIARFDDGAPALIEQRVGRGRVLYWAGGLGRGSGDFALQPAFVPFVQQLVRHAASGAQMKRTFTVGNVVDLNTLAPADRDVVVLTPTRERIRIGSGAGARTLRIGEPGIYQVRPAGENAVTQRIAANVDVSESDLAAVPAETFQDAVAPMLDAPMAAASVLPAADRERQQGIWWYLLLAAVALLAAETLLSNRISTAWRT